MSLRSAVVVVVDRLGAGFFGPYGNTWLETPTFNALAGRSLLVETALANSPLLENVYRSYWLLPQCPAKETGSGVVSGQQPFDNEELSARNDSGPLSLIAELRRRGISTVLVTDDLLVADHPLAADFARILRVPAPAADRCAEGPDDTGIARLLTSAADALQSLHAPYLLWVHARGMGGPWDAPLEYREQFRDEEDPLPGDFTAPKELRIDRNYDPDELLKVQHAYAGQVSLLDEQLAAFLAALDALDHQELLLAFTSPRGYPLGEHGRIGPCDDALYGELLQVPLLVQFPAQLAALARSAAILQPADLAALVAEHFDLPLAAASVLYQIARNEDHPPREIAVASGRNQRAIRTPAWFLLETASGDERHFELFAKPDDRWEVNEVSSRCAEEVELLAAALDQFPSSLQESALAPSAPLPELLRSMWR